MKTIIKLFAISIILISCHKNCPKPGDYLAVFQGTLVSNQGNHPYTSFYEIIITETTKDHIMVGNSELSKNGNKVTGIMSGGSYGNVQVDGKCSRKKGDYYIKGTYEGTYNGYPAQGTFEIKSN